MNTAPGRDTVDSKGLADSLVWVLALEPGLLSNPLSRPTKPYAGAGPKPLLHRALNPLAQVL